MRKAIYLGLSVCFLMVGKIGALDVFELLGKVKTVEHTNYKMVEKFGEYVQTEMYESKIITYYDRNQNIVKVEKYENGAKTSERSRNYDKQGNLSESCEYGPTGELVGKWVNSYDKEGKLVEESYYDKSGSLTNKNFTFYNAKGKCERVKAYMGDGELLTDKMFTYDAVDRIIEEIEYIADSRDVYYKASYEYTDDGYVHTMNHYKYEDGSHRGTTIHKYDKENRLISNEKYLPDGSMLSKVTCSYNDKGLTDEIIKYGKDGNIIKKTRVTYEYDRIGNWIKMTQGVDIEKFGKTTFQPNNVTVRIITYY